MAGDWIKMRLDLDEDPAVISIAERLSVHETAVIGMLWKFWAWADRQLVDGKCSLSLAFVDKLVGTAGFADAMLAVNWLTTEESAGFSVPKFDRHMGESAKKRAEASARQQLLRGLKEGQKEPVTKFCDKSVTAQRDSDAQNARPEKRREEKRREEKKREENTARALPPTAITTGDVAAAWCFFRQGHKSRTELHAAKTTFDEMVRLGLTVEHIDAEIRSPARNRTEPIWELAERLLPKKTNGKPTQDLFGGLRAFVERGNDAAG